MMRTSINNMTILAATLMWIAGLAWTGRVHAELPSAADYFNYGSATFIRDDPQKALAIVLEGIEHYPDNESLLRLKELLEQQQEQQNQNNQQDRQNEQEQDQEQEQNDSNEQNEDQPDQNDEGEPEQTPPEEDQQPPEPTAEEMTDEEAEMVLDSLRQLEQAQREQLMREIIRQQARDMPPVEKDW